MRSSRLTQALRARIAAAASGRPFAKAERQAVVAEIEAAYADILGGPHDPHVAPPRDPGAILLPSGRNRGRPRKFSDATLAELLAQNAGSITRTARQLGVSYQACRQRVARLGAGE